MGKRCDPLPEELVREILVKLPVKSVLRFKCVESCWKDLFESPSFIKDHHSSQLQQMKLRNEHRLMISHNHVDDPGDVILNSHCHLTLVSESEESEIDFHYLFPQFETRTALDRYLLEIRLFDHCNGVFCLNIIGGPRDQSHSLILWNPATREVKHVPTPPSPNPDYIFEGYYCGFGADPNSNILKIVHLGFGGIQIYDLFTDSWILVSNDNVPCALSPFNNTYLLDGVCFWRSFYEDYFLVSFDFRNNQLGKINLPPREPEENIFDFITQVNGSLAYAVYCTEYEAFHMFQLWIWKQDSWTKIYNVGPFDFHEIYGWCVSWKSGTEFIILCRDGSIVSYNSYGQPLRHFQISSQHMVYAGEEVASGAGVSILNAMIFDA